MKEELFKQILVENTLYKTDIEKDEFLSSDSNIINAFMYNFVGILGAYESAQVVLLNRGIHKTGFNSANRMIKDIKKYMKDDAKIRLQSITDDNNNISLVIKLMMDKDMFINSAKVSEMTRFLAKFKLGTVDRIDSNRIIEWIENIKKPALLKLDNKLKDHVNKFLSSEINIYELTSEFRKQYKRLKSTVGEDFWTAVKYVNFKSINQFTSLSPFIPDIPTQQASNAIGININSTNVTSVIDTVDDNLNDNVDIPLPVIDTDEELRKKNEMDIISKATIEIMPLFVGSALRTELFYNVLKGEYMDIIKEGYANVNPDLLTKIINSYEYIEKKIKFKKQTVSEDSLFNPIVEAGKYIYLNYAKASFGALLLVYKSFSLVKFEHISSSFIENRYNLTEMIINSAIELYTNGLIDNDKDSNIIELIIYSIDITNNHSESIYKLSKIIKPYNRDIFNSLFLELKTSDIENHKQFFSIINATIPDLSIIVNAMKNNELSSVTINNLADNFFNVLYIRKFEAFIYGYYEIKDLLNPNNYSFENIQLLYSYLNKIGIDYDNNILRLLQKCISYKKDRSSDMIPFNQSGFQSYEYKKELVEWMTEGQDLVDVLVEYTLYDGFIRVDGARLCIEHIMDNPAQYEKFKKIVTDKENYPKLDAISRYTIINDNKSLRRKYALDIMEYTKKINNLDLGSLSEFVRRFDLTENIEDTKRLFKLNNELGNPIFSKENIKNIFRRDDKSDLITDLFDTLYDLVKDDPKIADDFFNLLDKYYQDKIIERGISVGAVIREIESGEIKLFGDVDAKRVKQIFTYNNLDASEIQKHYKIRRKKNQTLSEYLIYVENELKTLESPLKKLAISNMSDDLKIVKASTRNMIENHYARKHGNIYPLVLREWDCNLEFIDEFNEFGKYCIEKYGSNDKIIPAYHGTGGIAASMILRYGFTILPESDQLSTARMLGNGIYFSNKVDKISLYARNNGYNSERSHGDRGYVFLLDTQIGKGNIDHRSDGFVGSTDENKRRTIRSPEWAVFNSKKQLRITKVYEVEIQSYAKYIEYVGEPMNESFVDFSKRQRDEMSIENFETFIFHDNRVPVKNSDGGITLEDEDYFKENQNDYVSFFNGKATVTIPSNKTTIYDKLARRMTSKELKYFFNILN